MPTYLKPTINGNCGKDKSFWGGRDVECTPTQPSSPITWSTQHDERSINMCQSLSPFHVRTGALVTCSDMSRRAWHGVPYMIYRGREDEALQTFQALGIVHALYIKYAIHNTTLFYISIVHVEKICT